MKALLFLLTVSFLAWVSLADQKSFDCRMRQLAMDYAHKIQPSLSGDHYQQIADALNGAQEAQNCNVSIPKNSRRYKVPPSFPLPRSTGATFYADPVNGKDSNSGSESSPFLTLEKGIDAAKGNPGSTLVLRKGTFYLTKTIELDASDSGLTIQNYQGEEVWISGGKVIQPQWKSYKTTGGMNIYQADLSAQGIDEMLGFRIDTMRMIRAKYPNADPETQGFYSTLRAKSWMPPKSSPNPDKEENPDTPLRNSSNMFQKFQLGIGGSCKDFDPPAGYWCGSKTQGGGAFTYRVPVGMVADKSVLPNQPYKDPTGAVIQAWRPGHWASWMFEVGSYDSKTSSFTFSKGGFQGARGNDNGDEFYIENVMEELDSANEWFFDKTTKTLYFFYNETSGKMPPADTLYVVPILKTLIKVQASQDQPAKGITIRGVNFRDTVYTYLDPHGMPSGGDWALERMGGLFIEGTEMTTVDSCIFERLDGNGIMISGYNRNATIHGNEFVWIGSSAIAQWGYTNGSSAEGMGPDGTAGNQPRFTNVSYNFVHELGIWEKQSSFYFQAKSCQNTLYRNIFFNGPRAGINFNDGFGGGSEIVENILFNTCRESSDHGPFNSWDRQVYVTKVLDGKTPSTVKQYDEIRSNFIVANYHSSMAIDNDDGSAYYKTHDNFFTFAGGMKNDFGGHDNHHYNNVYAFVSKGFGIVGQLKGHEDYFFNNSLIMTQDGNYGNPTCSGDGKTIVYNNSIYTPNGKVTECGMSLSDWQAKGNDPGSRAYKWPSDDQLEALVKNVLHM